MSKPNRKAVNLNKMRAQRTEADGEKEIEFVFGDPEETFTMPLPSWWSPEVTVTLRTLGLGAGFREIVGDKQYERLLELGITVGDLNALMEAANENAGVSLGESSASADSSKSTPSASKQT